MCLVRFSLNIARMNYIERRGPERIMGRWEGLKRSHFGLSTVRWKAVLGRRSGLLSAFQSETQLQGNESQLCIVFFSMCIFDGRWILLVLRYTGASKLRT
ncbi:hypothetical protein CC77DRAFT_450164 [Alternaria alternata]|jgi:hypothetical protein|uniref:Uncharacterized protein n=1 Tax=Alternaria alternata TaxID=5599 RepID=A0A177D8Q0_ALTAL|nr:hypothetical protein CC77DRAFT_450164 [Alternaria alternata]OAG15560.1 hypothetical protein CC77DRAFT_450164 [Alternaria alternata]